MCCFARGVCSGNIVLTFKDTIFLNRVYSREEVEMLLRFGVIVGDFIVR